MVSFIACRYSPDWPPESIKKTGPGEIARACHLTKIPRLSITQEIADILALGQRMLEAFR